MDNKGWALISQLSGFVLIWLSAGFWLALGALVVIRLMVWWRMNMFEKKFPYENKDAQKELRSDNFPVEGKDKIEKVEISEFRELIKQEKPEKVFAIAGGQDDVGTWADFYIRKSSGDLVKTYGAYPSIEEGGQADSRNDTFYASVNVFADSPYKYKQVEYPGIYPLDAHGRGRSKFILVENAD